MLPDPKPISTSTLSTPKEQEPSSPVRPELSDGEGDEEGEDVELNMAEIDWGEAMAEMDDLLNETDDDATDRDEEGSASSKNGINRSKKRSRPSAASTDDESDVGGGSSSTKADSNGNTTTESPLQKRVKTARSRSSGLKTSLSAAALAASSDTEQPIPTTSSGKDPQDIIDGAIGSAEMSQASSSISSDDEGFLASLEAELEAGFEEGGGDDGEEEE